MSENISYEVVVIGAGPAGIEAAKKLADNGKKVLLIDKHIGGNYCTGGSVVSNTLLHVSHLYERFVNKTSNFVDSECGHQHNFDFKKARKHVEGVASKVVKGFLDNLSSSGVEILTGFAVFKDKNTLTVMKEDGEEYISFEKAIIATGSNNMSANVPSTKKLLDTTNIFDLESTPKSVVVVGGGFIGTEYATFFKRIGCKVTLVEKSDSLLGSIDSQIVKEFEDQFRKSGVEIVKGVSVDRIEKVGNKTIIFLNNESKLEGEEVFVSIGRAPNIEKLKPENAGIKFDEKGYPKLTKKLKTSNSDIYMVGDSTGVNMFVNWAYMSADIAANDIMDRKRNISADLCPRILKLDPEIASVGMSEDEAKESGIEFKVIRHSFKNFEKSVIHGTIKGLVKILYSPDNKKILGCHAVGNGATDIVSTFAMMVQSKMPLTRLEDFVFNHPTYSSVLGDIAGKIK
ncbi:pyridine nucleotide-disulfide oxidoreductase dimerization region [Denitrovibrio acetiphilus DSM 12809]|uniref:Pyridine nucleotide-disulfide oxidoreductase dimerization region n=1 Tax=Denitrovibrio acetiphilus (strain DSM 12809 / NBRC 114555 / N2460) TaxID=522772 RepID=D4H861_DENA2|nr:NAD(P)/FAD-dependent oxidoreductase [Denitrovibrio acetiphilus]ADD68210.1 pyridine nucleotide-disulfide oxidoreductase dimerization region [Denitrovibrio acetiphilus DSM 12809]